MTELEQTTDGYIIQVKGQVSPEMVQWIGKISYENNGPGSVLLRLASTDQATLIGILRHLNDLGIDILSVTPFRNHPDSPS